MCYTPSTVFDHNGITQTVPCGKCEKCIKRRISAWSHRLITQDRYSSSAHFITFTYDRNHCPVTKRKFATLEYVHLRNYFKRLRIDHERKKDTIRVKTNGQISGIIPQPIKYYAVGEYGEKSGRPHYHAIIFNADITRLAKHWRCPEWNGKHGRGNNFNGCNCGKLMGEIHYGTVSGASVGYTLKYMNKTWKRKNQNDDRVAPRAFMSKQLGIDYLTPQMIAWHKEDLYNNMYLTVRGTNKKIAMPRYYKDKIYTPEERGLLKGYFEKKMEDQAKIHFDEKTGIYSREYHEGVKATTNRIYYSSTLLETL